jgi:hypothetical protein
MRNKIDKTIERNMFFHKEDTPPDNCPQCGQSLVQEFGPYQVATRSRGRVSDMFVMSGEFGYLCPGCATAVIHTPNLADMLYGLPPKKGWKIGPEFTVLGLVNLDAIPPDQAHIPLDDLENYPLVLFHPVGAAEKSRSSRKPRVRKPKPIRRK